MSKKLAIALWNYDASISSEQLDARVNGLDKAARRLQDTVTDNSHAGSFDSILAAPEYLFSLRNNQGERIPISEKQRMMVEQQVLEVSRKYPRMVMFPGTMFYCKDLIRPPEAGLKFNDQGHRAEPKTTPDNRRDRYAAKVSLVIQQLDKVFETPQDREAVRSKGVTRGNLSPAFSPSLNDIAARLADTNIHPKIVRNAAYMLLGGRRIAKIDKRSDFAETRGASADDLAFIPGTEKQCPEIDNYRFGVEICFDHDNGVLRRRNLKDLRFHVLLSDPAQVNEGNMTMMNGGFFLHASTDSDEFGVWQRDSKGSIRPVQGEDGGVISLSEYFMLYQITVG
jgi:predicted amidohydrolase